MPLIQVYHPTDGLTPERKTRLAERLTDVLIEIEGGPGEAMKPRTRSITWVMFHAVPAVDWYIGGLTDDTFVSPPGKFLVNITCPEGVLSKAGKALAHRMVDEVFHEVFDLGAPPPPTERHPSTLVMIHEWAEGNMGGFGLTFGLRELYKLIGADLTTDRRQRGLAYLEAWARAREAAGYPE